MKKLIALVISLIICLSCAALAETQQEALASTMITNASGAMLDNIDKAIAAINGKAIQPSVPFSFNQTVGPRTAEAGYGMAVNGNGFEKLGGGVSQVATTLYNALIQLPDIAFTERHTFGEDFCAGYAVTGSEAILTDYANNYDLAFASPSAYTIQMQRSGNFIYCGVVSGTPAAAAPADPNLKEMEVVNCQSFVNLRASASSQSESLAQLPLGTKVEAKGAPSAGFIEVIYNGMTGFIGEDYLK